jgi:hypothetical protein
MLFRIVQASTKDGELVVRPKLTLGDSTNIGDLRDFNSYRRSIVSSSLFMLRLPVMPRRSGSCPSTWLVSFSGWASL